MAWLSSSEHRIRVLDARPAEVEGGCGDTLCRVRRETRFDVGRLLDSAGLPRASDAEIDEH